MFKLEHVLLLKEDEQIKAITKRHGLALVPGLGAALLLIVAPFFFVFPLFRTGPAGVVMFAALVLVGLFVALRTFVMWDGDVFIVTNIRLVDVDQRGLFSRIVSEVKLEDVQDVSWAKNGLVDVLFKVGTLKVQTYSGALVIEAPFIPRPQELHNLVNDLRHTARSAGAGSPRPERNDKTPERADTLKRVTNRLAALDDAELVKLERTLKRDDRDLAIRVLFGNGEDPKLKSLEDTPGNK